MAQVLRPYQTDCVAAVLRAMEDGKKRILYTQATGLGKTTTMAELVKQLLEMGDTFEGHTVLCLAHRNEIVQQIHDRIAEHVFGYNPHGSELFASCPYIGIEQAESYAPDTALVVCASVFTVVSEKRLAWFAPTIIITDECHRSAAPTYQKIYKRFGVPETATHIGCTATAKRTDRQSLYAFHIDGSPVMIEDKKTKKQKPCPPEKAAYEYHAYERSILDGMEDGYLVPVVGHSVQTDTDLSEVETDIDGDFKDNQLQKAVNTDTRNHIAVSAWKQIASDRPTIAFCSGVDHAYAAAEVWKSAGYTAAALDGTTPPEERARVLSDFKAGRLQVLCNMGLFTEGMDAPICSCIVHMRPTKSWNLYVQMTGRGLRVLPGVVDHLEDATARTEAIQGSVKPDCLVIDLCDITKENDLCAVPSLLDLPAKLDLQGASLTAAKKLLDDYADAALHLEDEGKAPPATFQELKVRLEQVEMIRAAAKHGEDWVVSSEGYRFTRTPPGYTARLLPVGDSYLLEVEHAGKPLETKVGKPGCDFKAYLAGAARRASGTIEEHREAIRAKEPSKAVMPFGKYKGNKMGSLPTDYLRWVAENTTTQWVRDAARREVYRRLGHVETQQRIAV